MKKLLKIISAVLAAATLSALCPAAFAADSPEAHQAEAIDSLIRQEIVLGDEYGNVMESDPITREQMVSVIGRILDFDDSRFSGLEEYFTDAGQISDWAYSYVLEGFENGIVDGYPDKTFRPQNLMLYEEAVKFTLCAFLRLSDTDPAEYLKAYYTYPDGFIELARENNYLYGTNGTLGEPMSRGDVFTLIYNVANVTVSKEGSSGGNAGGIEEPTDTIGSSDPTGPTDPSESVNGTKTAVDNGYGGYAIDFNNDGVPEDLYIEDGQYEGQKIVLVYNKVKGEGEAGLCGEFVHTTKTSECSIINDTSTGLCYMKVVNGYSDASTTSIYALTGEDFECIDTWGRFTNKDNLPYVTLYRTGFEAVDLGYQITGEFESTEAEYEAYQSRFDFDVIFTFGNSWE